MTLGGSSLPPCLSSPSPNPVVLRSDVLSPRPAAAAAVAGGDGGGVGLNCVKSHRFGCPPPPFPPRNASNKRRLRERRLTRGACAGPDSDDSDGANRPTRGGRPEKAHLETDGGKRAHGRRGVFAWEEGGVRRLMLRGRLSESFPSPFRVLAHPTCPSLSESSRASVFSYSRPDRPSTQRRPAGRPGTPDQEGKCRARNGT